MRILVLAQDVPHPVIHGGRLRLEGMLRCLAQFARVHVLAAADPRSKDAELSRERLARLGVVLEVFQPDGPGPAERDASDVTRLPDAVAHFSCPGLRLRLPSLLAELRPDAVHVSELVMAQYLEQLPRPRVLDRQKVEFVYHRALAEAGGDGALAHAREAARFERWERELAGQLDRILVLGEGDRAVLAGIHGTDRVQVVPNGVADELRRPASRPAAIQHVLLYGSLDYAPNVEANALYFREIWPRLRESRPDLRTLVMGSGVAPPDLPRDDPHVELRGFVPDVGAVLRGPGVLVVPLRVGGGARNKILEALACGMPVISTPIGAEHLGLVPGRHFLAAETPDACVEMVLGLARSPAIAHHLSVAGAAHVEAGFRWDGIARALESQYAAATGRPAAARRRRLLLVGVRPGPDDTLARRSSLPGHRTAQFRCAAIEAGAQIQDVLLDEEEGAPVAFGPEVFRAATQLQATHDRFRPDIVVAAGGGHAARVVAHLATAAARFIDLPGDPAAEAQLRAERQGAEVQLEALSVLTSTLHAGDAFSVVGPSQRLALLGQLGLVGRLSGAVVGADPVCVIPIACAGPGTPPAFPAGPLRLLWSGGYDTWTDAETLLEAVLRAMSEEPSLQLVATGGGPPGHGDESDAGFWAQVRASRFAARFQHRGRIPREAALAECHVVLAISRPCLESELGSRLPVVEAAAHGRPAILTAIGDLSREVADADAGVLVPPGDAPALAHSILGIARDTSALARTAANARRLWETRWTYAATAGPLRRWIERPRRWPASQAPGETATAAQDAARFRLQADLDTIRASLTFRALRRIDRLLGRARR
jgi:polysaccharide biosynthesis protein PslH